MVKIELRTSTIAVLIAGLYSIRFNVDSMAIPESVFILIAETLENYIPLWDFNKIGFEDWVSNCLWIYPTPLLSDVEIADLKKNTLYWEVPNGNVMLSVSMDINDINGSGVDEK